ncbi:hypothetical protein [Pararhizobium gei]|uniref:hypothetical protein n=1 Tax=Pararhizobium gei TaxID=1395951 RepID=UPI0023DB2F59|nr:hypothetical protein [Rhizobium gei]
MDRQLLCRTLLDSHEAYSVRGFIGGWFYGDLELCIIVAVERLTMGREAKERYDFVLKPRNEVRTVWLAFDASHPPEQCLDPPPSGLLWQMSKPQIQAGTLPFLQRGRDSIDEVMRMAATVNYGSLKITLMTARPRANGSRAVSTSFRILDMSASNRATS